MGEREIEARVAEKEWGWVVCLKKEWWLFEEVSNKERGDVMENDEMKKS